MRINEIRIFKERLSGGMMLGLVVLTFVFLVAMGVGLYLKSAPILHEHSAWEMLTSSEWRPSQDQFGFLPFVAGTLCVTAIALIIALPLAFFTAVFLSEYAPQWTKKAVFPALDILASLPSVIYGVWGTLIIVPLVANHLAPHDVEYSSGFSMLAAGLVLCVMILPLMVSLFVELFAGVPNGLREASTSLGATRWQTTRKVVVRHSLSGIFAAVVLAVSKAMGETIAVLMVCGNMPKMPHSLFDPCYPVPALLANNYGEMMSVPKYEAALMFSALILFVVVIVFNLLSRVILYRVSNREK